MVRILGSTVANLTRFEFLRNVFLPDYRKVKEDFLDNEFLFEADQNSNYAALQSNAMLLSQIYAHKKLGEAASLVDLMLASRVMYQRENTLLFTGNKRHFPSIIFDIETVINSEEVSGTIRSFCLLSFNPDKFNYCVRELEESNSRYSEKAQVLHEPSTEYFMEY